MTAQLFVFPIRPMGQRAVQLTHIGIQRRAIVPPVKLQPAPDLWIEHPHPEPTSPAGSRRNPDGTTDLSPVPVSISPPFARSDPIRWESPTAFPRRLPSV